MEKGSIIILNGVGSVGKSSTAKALQAILVDPFLHVPGDAFLEMLPASMFGHPDGIVFRRDPANPAQSIIIEMGPALDRLMRGMRGSIASLALAGNSLIVDDVMLGAEDEQHYRDAMPREDYRLVGLFAPLDVLERREADRGDRLIGLARWQYDRVHAGIVYDLEIDTSALTPDEVAHRIATELGLKTSCNRDS